MKRFVVLMLVVSLCICTFSGCNKQGVGSETTPVETVATTDAPKTEMELALEGFISNVKQKKVPFESFKLFYNDYVVSLSAEDHLDVVEELVKSIYSTSSSGVDSSIMERYNPDIVGVKERLSYKRIMDMPEYRGSYWYFFVDSNSTTETVKWLELDPLANYDGSFTVTVNDVGLSTPISDVLLKWGTPDYAGVDIKDGEEVVIMRWDYDMGAIEGYCVSAYVCFKVCEGTIIESSVVDNLYVNFENTV